MSDLALNYSDLDLENGDDSADIIQLVGLNLGDEEYAIDVLKIQEIIRMVEITIVPRTDNFILGVMNLRGKVISVIDLRARFNLDKVDFNKSTRIIVVKFEKENIGFVVDEVTQVIGIRKSMIEPTPPLVGSVGQEYILGICKHNDNLMILLDIDKVIGDNEDESFLKKRFDDMRKVSKDVSKSKFADKIIDNPIQNISLKEANAETAEPSQGNIINKYSSADNVSTPLISKTINITSKESEVLDEVKSQFRGEPINNANFVAQTDLDDLIAKELALREAETEELNRKRKSPNDDIDTLIAKELALREAETEEMNKKKHSSNLELPNIELNIRKGDLEEIDKIVESIDLKNIDTVNPTSLYSREDCLDIIKEEIVITKDEIVITKDEIVITKDEQDEESLNQLKKIAKRVISGDSDSLSDSLRGDFKYLIQAIAGLKSKIVDIAPDITKTKNSILPTMRDTLSSVNHETEKATFSLLNESQKLISLFENIRNYIDKLKNDVMASDEKGFEANIAKVKEDLSNISDSSLAILANLEFQDITEQKLNKLIHSAKDVSSRLKGVISNINLDISKNGIIRDLDI